MDNDNTLPLKVGKLPKECYANWQEFADDLAKVLGLAQDNKEIIIGAKGIDGLKGNRGDKGNKGDKGEPGTKPLLVETDVDILNASTYVEFDLFTGWQNANYEVMHKGELGSGLANAFVPASGIVSVGTIVQVYDATLATKGRAYFTFLGTATVPDAFHYLKISYFQ